MNPLVSILIPAYNAGQWLASTVESALAQTWSPIEVIVVDDGSTDNTLAVARSFENRGVRVYARKNRGAAAARNEAFRLSKGEYIQWLDADDLLSPDKIALQMQQRGSCRLLLSSAWGSFLYRQDRAEFTPSALWADLSPLEWLINKMGRNLHMQTGTWLVSRALTEVAGPWDEAMLSDDDGEYFCRVLLASEGTRFVPGAKVYYRTSGNSSLSYIGRSEKKIRAHWQSMQRHIRSARSLEDSERVHCACVSYLRNWLIHFYPEQPDIVRQAAQLAAELGGSLGEPPLSWKYAWIRAICGWRLAKRAQLTARSLRWSVKRSWDKALFNLGHQLRSGDDHRTVSGTSAR